jgi:E3 ubiquitin-protein ligase MARCH6
MNRDWYDFPIQLILFKLFIFYFVIDQIKSRIPYQSLFTKWFHTTARILRISNFLIGGEHPDEESDDEDDDETPRREFRYMRVPRTDHIPIVPGQRVLVPMREGEEVQGREGESEDEVREFWTCVYVPAHFKLRVLFF